MSRQHKNNKAKLEPSALCSCDILHSCYRIFCKMVLNNSWFSFRMQKKQFILFREVMTLNKFQNCKTWETRYRPHYNLRYPHPHPLQWRSVSGWGLLLLLFSDLKKKLGMYLVHCLTIWYINCKINLEFVV